MAKVNIVAWDDFGLTRPTDVFFLQFRVLYQNHNVQMRHLTTGDHNLVFIYCVLLEHAVNVRVVHA